jgi:hypothetical protein
MARDPRGLSSDSPVRRPRSSRTAAPGSTVDRRNIVSLTASELQQLGLPATAALTVDRGRRPNNGDLVWVELVRHGSTQRLIRRYALDGGWVTLTVADETSPAIMRRHSEVLILGVVDVDDAAAGSSGPATG